GLLSRHPAPVGGGAGRVWGRGGGANVDGPPGEAAAEGRGGSRDRRRSELGNEAGGGRGAAAADGELPAPARAPDELRDVSGGGIPHRERRDRSERQERDPDADEGSGHAVGRPGSGCDVAPAGGV